MTRTAPWAGFVAILILTSPILVEAQRGSGMGGGRGGMRGGMDRGGRRQMPQEMQDKMEALRALPLEQIWSAMSFGIDLPDSQLVAIKPLFTNSWAQKQQILRAAAESSDWDEARDELKRLKKDLDRKLKTVLTRDQRKALEKLVKKQDDVSKIRMFR